MASSSQKTKMTKIQNSNLFTFFATLSGVVVGVVASLAMMGPMVRTQVAAATRGLDARPVSSLSCATSGGGSGAAANSSAVKTSGHTNKPQSGGSGGGMGGGGVTKIIGGFSANTHVSMKNTGPGSHNSVTTVNKNSVYIENNNNVSVSNSNDQEAVSGAATVSGNTNGGSAHSGQASNENKTSTGISIEN
jgi:hypothetical protein